jgi:hypothetical protein
MMANIKYMVVILGLVFVGACGGEEPYQPGVESQPINVAGSWNGTWRTNTNSSSGGVTINITQSSTNLNGHGTLTNVPLINTQQGPLSGTLNGNVVSGAIKGSLADVEFKVTISQDGKRMTGTYKLSNTVEGILDLSR